MFQSKKNIISGRNPVTEALRQGNNIDKILLFKNASGESVHEIRRLAKERQVPVQYVPNEKLNALTNTQHQGVIAFRSAIQYQDLQQVIDWINDKGEAALFLMLDGITDVRNIGGIARSLVCCGAHALIIPEKGVGALNEDACKKQRRRA
jgi:23S rRNA (guanosine2251-2'-O)-methyltransferase